MGFHINADTPDENTIRHFRNRLAESEILDDLMGWFQQLLQERGYEDKTGQILDASIVECSKQHNTPLAKRGATLAGEGPAQNVAAS